MWDECGDRRYSLRGSTQHVSVNIIGGSGIHLHHECLGLEVRAKA